MKIYIVTCGYDYEDSSVLGVYTTKEKAENAIEDKENDYAMDWYEITEWELDKEEE